MPNVEFATKPKVEVDGSPLSEDLDPLLEQVIVDDHLHLPDMFTLRFRDPARDVLQQAKVQIGTAIRVLAGAAGEVSSQLLITGEVTSIEGEFGSRGTHTVVRGYDPSHRLHRGRVTETYKNMKDSDIAKKVADGAQIPVGTIEDSQKVHPLVSQANLTAWEFLKARATEIGFEVLVLDGKFVFRRPPQASEAPGPGTLESQEPLQLVQGTNLESFHPRVTSAEQVKEVQVRGWDPDQKKALVGTSPAKTTSAELSTSPEALAGKFGNGTFVVTDRPFSSQPEVDEAAKVFADHVASTFAEAEGVARGTPRLKAGAAVSVAVVGEAFEGRYTVTSSQHVFDDGGYKTRFIVSGRQERSLLGLTSMGSSNGSGNGGGPPMYGVVIALVTDVRDPEDLGRIKIRFPWLSDTYESDWVRVVQLGAGKERGTWIMPEINDEVLVAFEHGDIRRPYVLGGLYNKVDTPDSAYLSLDQATGARHFRAIGSRNGHGLVFGDDPKKDSGVALFVEGSTQLVALSKRRSRVLVRSDGSIEIQGGGPISIRAGGAMQVRAGQDMRIEAGGKLEIKAASISIRGDQQVEVVGNAGVSVQSANTMDVKGALTTVEGSGTLTVRGALVRIN
jgi:phage protein D/phage baseplate assembly protein gpV